MSSLINVRLDSERFRKARVLRECGITLSDLLREAIDERFLSLRSERTADAQMMIAGIFEPYPDPVDLPSRDDDVHDRRAPRSAILHKLSPAK
ncbi:MAG: hypothetical protein SFV54_22805 [Bryobacteraceae bacterium]|nr:hypothetical protein [Bryobacteraceae bacterium]